MPVPVAFEQHPDYQPGVGDFIFDDGRRVFGHDPDLAGALASNDPGMRQGTSIPYDDYQRAQQPPAPTPTATDAVGPVQGAPPASPQQTPQVTPQDAQRAANWQYVNQPVRSVARAAGYVPKTKAETVETTAPPVDEGWLKEWGAAQAQMAQAQHAVAATTATRADAERASLEAQMPALEAQAAEARAKKARIDSAVEGDRMQLRQAMSEAGAKKIDPDRFFQSRGTMGQISILLGQAFGAYAATLGHGRNFAQEQIDQLINNDIAAQRAEIEQGNQNVNNALARYNLTYKDLDQAEAALRATQQSIVANHTAQFAAINKSTDAQNAFRMWSAQQRLDMLNSLKQFDTAAYGKHTAQISAQYREGQTGGTREATPKEKLERMRVVKEAADLGMQPDLSPEGARKNRALDISEAKAAKEGKGKEDATAQGLNIADRNIQRAQRIKELFGKGGLLSPKERGEMSALQTQLALELPSVFSHSKRVNETEIEMMHKLIGDPNSTFKPDPLGSHAAGIDTVIDQMLEEKRFLQKHGAPSGGEDDRSNATPGFSGKAEDYEGPNG